MESTPFYTLLERCIPALPVVAATAAALWVGIVFSVSWLSGRARWMADGCEIGSMAVTLSRRWGRTMLIVSLVSAMAWIWTLGSTVVSEHSVVEAGAVVLVLLLIHAGVDARAVRVSRGSVRATRGEGARRAALMLSLAALAALVVVPLAR
jgi:hypothetical protein